LAVVRKYSNAHPGNSSSSRMVPKNSFILKSFGAVNEGSLIANIVNKSSCVLNAGVFTIPYVIMKMGVVPAVLAITIVAYA